MRFSALIKQLAYCKTVPLFIAFIPTHNASFFATFGLPLCKNGRSIYSNTSITRLHRVIISRVNQFEVINSEFFVSNQIWALHPTMREVTHYILHAFLQHTRANATKNGDHKGRRIKLYIKHYANTAWITRITILMLCASHETHRL